MGSTLRTLFNFLWNLFGTVFLLPYLRIINITPDFYAIFKIAHQAINTPSSDKNTLIFNLIRHKHRQHPRVAIHMVPRYLAAGEEAYQGDVA